MSKCLSRLLLLSLALSALPAADAVAAQEPQSATVLVRLGVDTVAVERWTIGTERVEAVTAFRTPRTVIRRYVVELDADRGPVAFAAGAADAELEMRQVQPAGAVPVAGGFYAPFALAVTLAAAEGEDAAELQYMLGNNAVPVTVRRSAPGTYELTNAFGAPMHVRLDERGRIAVMEVAGGWSVESVPGLDFDALAAEFVARDERGAGLGPLSPRDTVQATVAGASLTVDYARPAARGRTVFGELVPYGEVWRTGANEATTLTIDRALEIGVARLEAGTYTLFTVPHRDRWELIVNAETGQGGLAHDPDHDVVRVPMQVRRLAEPVEWFTIEILDRGEAGELRLSWEHTEAAVEFTPVEGTASAAAPAHLAGGAQEVGQLPGPTYTSDERYIAIVGATVIPMDGERVLENHTVLVRNGRIARMGPAYEMSVPESALRVEAQGRYLMPGLAEMHAHIPASDRDEIARVLFLYLANGITVARGMLGSPEHLEIREVVRLGELAGPRVYTSGPSFRGGNTTTPEDAARRVREQAEAGYDLLKIHPGLSVEVFEAIASAAQEAGIPFAGHVSEEVGVRRVLAAGQASIDHLDRYMEAILRDDAPPGIASGWFGYGLVPYADPDRIPEIARVTAEAGVWNVPTQSLMEHLVGPEDPETLARRPEMRYVPRQAVDAWAERKRQLMAQEDYSPERAERYIQLRRQMILALHQAGAGIALGSDAPQIFNVPGFSIHEELRMYVDAGLTPYEALLTGTHNIARYFGRSEDFGTVAVDRWADLVLLDGNPLSDIGATRDPAGVMVAGRWFSREALRQGLESIAAARAGG